MAAERRRQELAGLQGWRVAAIAAGAVAALSVAGALVSYGGPSETRSGLFVLAAVAVGVLVVAQLVRQQRRARARRWVRREQARLDTDHAAAQRAFENEKAGHEARIDEYRREKEAFDSQWQWWAIAPGTDLSRIDVLGGASSGWSADQGAPAGWDAMLTTYCGTRVEAGAEVTVIDLTGAAVAQSALDLFEAGGVARAAYLLPRELPLVHLGANLPKELLHEVLSNVVHVAEETGTLAGWAQDSEILRRVIDCFPDAPTVAQVLAGLRVLTQLGDVRDEVAAGLLTYDVLNKLNVHFGERAIQAGLGDRLLKVVTHLQPLATLSTTPKVPRGVPLKVFALDRRAAAVANEMLRAFLISAYTVLVNQVEPVQPWRRSIVVCGAERVTAGALTRLVDACASAKVGLVLMYQSADETQQKLIGRGNAAVVFMRLGTLGDATFASEFLGTRYEFVLSQITETVGESITDTTGDSYSKTVGTSETMTENWGESSSQGFSGTFLNGSSNEGTSTNHGISKSLGYNESTTWGKNTSQAVGSNNSNARSLQRTRENLVEPHELQGLPATAFIYSRSEGSERTAMMGDANPQIAVKPQTSALTLDEGRDLLERARARPGARPEHA